MRQAEVDVANANDDGDKDAARDAETRVATAKRQVSGAAKAVDRCVLELALAAEARYVELRHRHPSIGIEAYLESEGAERVRDIDAYENVEKLQATGNHSVYKVGDEIREMCVMSMIARWLLFCAQAKFNDQACVLKAFEFHGDNDRVLFMNEVKKL